MKTNLKAVMKAAWEMARAAAVNFGGKAREFFAESLKMAWAEQKNAYNFDAIKSHPGFAEIRADIVRGVNSLSDCGGDWILDEDEIAAFLADNPHHPEAKRKSKIAEINAMWLKLQKLGVKSWESKDEKKNRYYLNGSRETGDEYESAFFEVETGKFGGNNESIVARLKSILTPYLKLKGI